MTLEQNLALIGAANRAPSVHNIQPARFRFDDDRTIMLLEDGRRRLFVGDPEGKDNLKSLGAAAEGLALALSEQGLGADFELLDGPRGIALNEIARARVVTGAACDRLARLAEARACYRGAFAPREERDRTALTRIAEACPDLCVVEAPEAMAHIADLFDAVSMEVLRGQAYRGELLSWMRLAKNDPNYRRDGLSAEHMALSSIEAFGAEIVLGAAFPVLDRMYLARPLVAEGPKARGAAGLALFHRPASEPEFETGRRFYRIWLEVEREGLVLCPMSVLADVPRSAQELLREFMIGPDRKLVTAFRIGRRPHNAPRPPRARLPATELLAPA